MNSYISLLRGINVSGKNKIKMADLRAMYEKLDFQSVESYIQSGNVKFDYQKTDTKILAIRIKEEIRKEFGYDINVLVLNREQVYRIADNNPFLKGRNEDIKFLHVTMLENMPDDKLLESISGFQSKDDEFIIKDDIVYIFTPGGYGRTKLSNNFFERKLKISATTRNWKTILKLKNMIEPIS